MRTASLRDNLVNVGFLLSLISGLTMTGKNFLKSRKELVGNVTKPVCP